MPTVLVVDDDADVLDAVIEVLLSDGFAVQRAQRGEAALRFLQAGPLPDLVLLDARMDVVDGTTVSRLIRAEPATREVPIVFMTADRRFRPPEGMRLLQKPFAVDELLDIVHATVQGTASDACSVYTHS